MEKIFMVWASWELESILPLVGFECEEDAEVFAVKCNEFQETEPEDGLDEWELNHPAKEFITCGDHLSGVDNFYSVPLTVKAKSS